MSGVVKESMHKYIYLMLLFKAVSLRSTERGFCLFFFNCRS